MMRDGQQAILSCPVCHVCVQWQCSKGRIGVLLEQTIMETGDDLVDWVLKTNGSQSFRLIGDLIRLGN